MGRRDMLRRACLGAVLAGAAVAMAAAAQSRCADYVPQPKPQNASRDIVGQDLDAILEQGFIEFAAFDDFAPWSFGEKGEIKGVDIEIGKLIAADLGVEPRFRLVEAGENLEADLRNWLWKGPVTGGKVANVMLHVPVNRDFTCRVEQVVFTGQAYRQQIAIAYSETAYPGEVPGTAYFRYDPVGVENDTIADFYLSSLAGGQLLDQIHRYPSTLDAVAAIGTGEVKAAMGPMAELEYARPAVVKVVSPPLPGFGAGRWTVGVGVHFAYRPLAYAVDDAISAALEDGRIQAIFAGYGLTWMEPER
ncbi:ABC transporter substrate-binding protein [Mangrovicoccus sp. HB161399]|uniref:substrate-binding periplasmic protein n=1 Tax=Mangrovicoccus sp. HB161399 TaxID=2720392 RepID=UPI0020A6D737|nr:transporter substrate-binding domain-containing protein [Mangrovicoccus sp. HB161399]